MIKLGICVAYDWELLNFSLPAIYKHVDQICLSIDSDRISWNGNSFELDWNAFSTLIRQLDVHNKIQILQESFYNTSRSPIENENYQRSRMAAVLGQTDWIIQIDTDEIIMNARDLILTLKKYSNSKRPTNVHGVWINLIKHLPSGFIYSVLKTPPLATNKPQYEYGRTNSHFDIYINIFLAHITWARKEDEVYYKLKNWGHSHEFNGESFFKIWQALDEGNWQYIKDFHPMNKNAIHSLFFHPSANLQEFLITFDYTQHRLPKAILLANNIWISRTKKALRSIGI
jgi:hypothetical protein